MGMFDELIGEAIVAVASVVGGAVIGLVAGLLVCTIIEVVEELITKWNINGLIRKALQNSKEKKAREMLGKAIKGVVKGKEVDCVSIDLFEEGSEEKVCVKLKTSKGVDNSVTEGMAIAMYA